MNGRFIAMHPSKSKEEVVQEYRIQSIQEAAMRVIARKGMAAATMQEIADEAGIAKGTIYLYFQDRDDLVEKTFERAITQLIERADAALASGSTFEEKLRRLVESKVQFFRENREFFRLYASLRFPEGNPSQQRRHRRACKPQYQAQMDRMAAVLREAMERGEIRTMDPARLAIFVSEGIQAIVIQRITEEVSPPESEDVELITSTLLAGMRVRH
jgi:AcrR family transcriptional regulator